MIPFRFIGRLLLLLFVLGTCDAIAPEAQAGLGSFFTGAGSRARVVQVCVVTAAFSLLIILKKFSPDDSPPAFAPKMNYAPPEKTRGHGDKEAR